jgi:epoxyqueuosine reductase
MSTEINAADAIRRKARNLGFSDCRFAACEPVGEREASAFNDWLVQGMNGTMDWFHKQAEARVDPRLRFPWAKSVIVLRWDYANVRPEVPKDSVIGRIARYAATLDYHEQLEGPLEKMQRYVRRFSDKAGADASGTGGDEDDVGAAGQELCKALWYQDTGPILEHIHAQRAGIGWTGKHTLTLNEQDGSYFFLAEVVTSLSLPADAPAQDHCGSCTACIDACPTGAIFEPYRLDARRCISYLTIEHPGPVDKDLRPKMAGLFFGCDICQEVCPHNQRSVGKKGERGPSAGWRRPELEALTLGELLLLRDPRLEAAIAGTPLARSGVTRLKRNAAYVAGYERDVAAIKGLVHCLTHPETEVREACVWALGRIGSGSVAQTATGKSAFREVRQALSTHQKRETEEWVRDAVVENLAGLTPPSA